MSNRIANLIILLIILASFGLGIYYYPQLSDPIASHWNIRGEVDGYMSKFWGVFLMPMISIALFILFLLIPKMDPKKANIEKFRGVFNNFIVFIFAFLFYIFALTLAWNLEREFDFVQFLVPAFSILFFYMSILIENAEPNFSIGLRTPWTLSNDEVWKKTHQLGGKMYKTGAVIGLLGLLFPSIAFYLIIGPVILGSIFLVAYSYFLYRKLVHNGK